MARPGDLKVGDRVTWGCPGSYQGRGVVESFWPNGTREPAVADLRLPDGTMTASHVTHLELDPTERLERANARRLALYKAMVLGGVIVVLAGCVGAVGFVAALGWRLAMAL